jgi:LacI family transcriptional regulator
VLAKGLTLKPKRVTSQDVADQAGVSRTTVSLVLNDVPGTQFSEETRQRVIATADRLGYVPDAAARALASRRSQIIGLVLTRNPHSIASDGFLTQVLDGCLEVVHQHGLRLLIDVIDPQHQKEAYLQLVKAKHIDGLILSGPRFDDLALQALEEQDVPVVLMGQIPEMDFYSVDVDNRNASRTAVEHLAKLGHTRIALITNADPTYTAASERLAGYREALEAAQIVYVDKLVRYGDFDVHSGYNQMSDLLDSGETFTAAFVASDEVAFGAKAAIRACGLNIPEDIALVGYDNLPLAKYMEPPLTTIQLPALNLARQACELLIKLLEGVRPRKKQVLLDTHLVVRESCGAHLKIHENL